MNEKFKVMEQKIEKYFNTVTDEQLEKDLERADYTFYRSVKVGVPEDFWPEQQFSVFSKPTSAFDIGEYILDFEEFFPDSYIYMYQLAA